MQDHRSTPHPYVGLGAEAFWRSAITQATGEDFSQLFRPKFSLTVTDRIATAGSCFAQHLGRALQTAGCALIDGEPAPETLTADQATRFGYGLYSCRYGNIYTPRQLLNLLIEARVEAPPVFAWEKQGRWFDALRQTVEPEGLETAEEVAAHRLKHLIALRHVLGEADVFVFTLGMTEAWQDIATEQIFPVCPGVIAGEFNPDTVRFLNFRYPQIFADLAAIRTELKAINPSMRLLLTVSPVPLTATASGRHVLTATSGSKATLRAAAEDFAAEHADVDYFPSYEIVTSPAARGKWFEANLRQVRAEAVQRVMAIFLAAYDLVSVLPACPSVALSDTDAPEDDGLICEDQLLQAFAK
jgi:hypothetical protein